MALPASLSAALRTSDIDRSGILDEFLSLGSQRVLPNLVSDGVGALPMVICPGDVGFRIPDYLLL